MSLVLNDSTDLTSLGDAIRAKTGDSGLMTVAEMVTAVSGIETSGNDNLLDINGLTRNNTSMTFGSTSQYLSGTRCFSCTLHKNFVFGILFAEVRMQASTSTMSTSNYIPYRATFLIWKKPFEELTSKTDVYSKVFNWLSLNKSTWYNDDPKLTAITINQTTSIDHYWETGGDTENVVINFSLGPANGSADGYSYKVITLPTNNLHFYEFYKSE